MKKLLFWIVLIVGTVALLGSCAKKDDATAAASTSVTSTTASGSITVGSETLSGTYVSTCNTTAFAAAAGLYGIFPSDIKSGKTVMVVTSDTTFSDEMFMFTDTSCSTPSATIKNGRDNVTVGVASGSNYLVTYGTSYFKVTAHTAVAQDNLTAGLIANISDIDLTTLGKEFSSTGSSSAYKNVWSVTSTTYQQGEELDNGTQPTVMDSMVMTKE